MKKVIIICTVEVFLAVLILVIGIAAEGKRVKSNDVYVVSLSPFKCKRIEGPAFGLAISAAMFLLVGLILLNVASTCFSVLKSKNFRVGNRKAAIVFAVVSWILFFVAEIRLWTGAAYDHGVRSCYIVKPVTFFLGGLAGAASLSFGVIGYYLTERLSDQNHMDLNPTAGVSMAAPTQYPYAGATMQYPYQNPYAGAAMPNPNRVV